MADRALTVEFDDARIRASLQRLIDLGRDQSALMEPVANYLESSTRLRFETQTAPDGSRWKPSLRAKLTGKRTLTRDRHLLDSVSHDSGRDFAQVGVNRIYAAIHQFGGVIRPTSKKALKFQLPGGQFATVRSVTMPARPYLGLSTADENAILKRIERAINEAADAR